MLVPEFGNALVRGFQPGREHGVVALREAVEEVGALLGLALDLRTDVIQCPHTRENDDLDLLIPLPVSKLPDPFLVQSEVVADFVEDGDPDLPAEPLGVVERLH